MFRAHAEGSDVRSELEILHNSGSICREIRFRASQKCTSRALARKCLTIIYWRIPNVKRKHMSAGSVLSSDGKRLGEWTGRTDDAVHDGKLAAERFGRNLFQKSGTHEVVQFSRKSVALVSVLVDR